MLSHEQYKETIAALNEYTKAYDEGNPIISDKQWDELYFKVVQYENCYGYFDVDSPSNRISYTVVNDLKKVVHSHPMLSLNKTKDYDSIKNWCEKYDNNVVAMAKADGLTCSLTYAYGNLVRAETRGDGKIGEDITHNARVIKSIPNRIEAFKDIDMLSIDGEVVCLYQDFESFKDMYKNPRNFASGSIRLLDANESARRNLSFIAWDIIDSSNKLNCTTFKDKLNILSKVNFIVIPYTTHTTEVSKDVALIQEKAKHLGLPTDGLVYRINDNNIWTQCGYDEYSNKGSIALKLYDETYETRLIDINWTMGRTGVLTPVAYFEPVVIDGTTIQNASLHNISVLKQTLGGLPVYKNQPISVYKANMIIPQIEQVTSRLNSGTEICVPTHCMYCNSVLEHCVSDNNIETIRCTNTNCDALKINKILHFVSKAGLDIPDLSIGTITDLYEGGFIRNYTDLFRLHNRTTELLQRHGYSTKSVTTLLSSIEAARTTSLGKFICALGIPNVGTSVSKKLAAYFKQYNMFRDAVISRSIVINGIGNSICNNIYNFDFTEADALVQNAIIKFKETNSDGGNNMSSSYKLKDMTFCITGKLEHFKNRGELVKLIEDNGGIFVKAVTSTCNYLIMNDDDSTSTKARTARRLGTTIITEREFLNMIK